MQPRRVLAVFRKELIQIRRDPRSLIQIVLMPVMLLLLYGYALTFDIKHVPTAVYDQGRSQISREFLNRFLGSPYFSLTRYVDSYQEAERLLDHGEVRLILVLAHDFGRKITGEQAAKVQAIIDGSDANTANVILGYVQAVAADFNQKIMLERLEKKGQTTIKTPIRIEPRVWFNEDMESRNFIVPGLIVVIMTMVGSTLTALSVVREAERGSMEGLMASPLKRAELILGKVGPYFIIGMVDMAIAMGMGQVLFEVPMRGSWLLMVSMSALYLLVMLGQGLLISVVSSNQVQANQLAMLTSFLPAFLLSGFMFDIGQMPLALQGVSYLVPARYFVSIVKDVYLKGLGLETLWPQALLLVGFAFLYLVAAVRRFSKKVR
ncbi:MAG: ABC transporter permease [Desulfarculus sp.]|nr:ABC transporter permease [Desulfarculus sp.]